MKKRIIRQVSIQIPFKAKFAHHSKTRESTETIVVEIKNNNGNNGNNGNNNDKKPLSGFGESCPRSYVTGEDIQSAQIFIAEMAPLLEQVYSLDELKRLKASLTKEIDKNPSAWCALEMAMLDLLAREKNISVEKLLGLHSKTDTIPYSGVIGIDSFTAVLLKFIIYKSLGFNDFKIKLSGEQAKDLKTLKLISRWSKKVRVDANNLFTTPQEAIAYLLPLRSFIWAVEEPVGPHAFTDMKEIAMALKIKIILDESFLNIASLENIKGMHEMFIPNLRISKLGGVLRTLELVAKLEESNFHWILGSHVGEMSLLTRASLLISGNCSKALIAIEGGFSTHLLSYDPFFPNLKLGMGASIKNKSLLDSAGWGMKLIKKEGL
ncbi:MAG: enolase C-terminal domain-like protein [Bacteriovorax sp.]|nr:enolase C-terminal domain-like protein [Bacteriovorax sp.]